MPEKPVPTEPAKRPDVESTDRQNAPGTIAAFVCGLLSLACFAGLLLGPVTIIIALGAKRKIREDPELYKGMGLATAGLILGTIGLLLSVAWLLLWTYGLFGTPTAAS